MASTKRLGIGLWVLQHLHLLCLIVAGLLFHNGRAAKVAILHECAGASSLFACMALDAKSALVARYPDHTIDDAMVLSVNCTSWITANASAYRVIVFVGYAYEGCLSEGANFPGTWFLSVDVTPPSSRDLSNVVYGIFGADEASYAAGYLAGLLTESKVVGVVAGFPFASVKSLFNGFSLGVSASCSDCVVDGSYIFSFAHTVNGEALAEYLVNESGADVIFGCGGGTGSAGILRASELGAYSIGVDVDEFVSTFASVPAAVAARIATSALKKVDVAVEVGVALLIDEEVGSDVEGVDEMLLLFDYANGAVGLADCHAACSAIGASTWQTVSLLEQNLGRGLITVDVDSNGLIPLPSLATDSAFKPAPNVGFEPVGRTQHAMAYFSGSWKSQLAVFGGAEVSGDSLNDLWLYELGNARWMSGDMGGLTVGDRPPSLEKACLVGMGSYLLLFGGRDGSSQSSDAYIFRDQPDFLGLSDVANPDIVMSWTKVIAEHGPGLEHAACASLNATCLLVFGGRAAFSESKVLHRLCMDSSTSASGTWAQLWTGSSSSYSSAAAGGPAARQGAGAVVVDGEVVGLPEESQVLIVVGGASAGELRTEVWCWGLESSVWHQLPDIPFGTESAPLLFEDTKDASDGSVQRIFIAQLTTTSSEYGLGAFVLDVSSNQWVVQSAVISDAEGGEVGELLQATAVRASGRTWLFGGQLSDGTLPSVLYNAEFAAYADCAPGYEADGLDCVPCQPGTVSIGGVAAICQNCSAGHVANGTGSSSCSSCPSGQYSEAGWDSCEDCPAGWTTEEPASGSCTRCSIGRFSRAGGSCEACEVGRYSDSQGTSECNRCSGDLTTHYPGSETSESCVCPEGTYRPTAESERTTCLPCPEGMTCPLGSDWRNLLALEGIRPQVMVGYMTLKSNPGEVFQCMSETPCPGGDPGTCASLRDSTSIACGKCQGSAYESSDDCKPCEDSWGVWPFITFILGGCGCVLALTIGVNRDMILQTHGGVDLVVLSGLTISSLQTLGLFSNLTILWFQPINAVLEALAFLSLDLEVFQMSCYVGTSPLSSYVRSQCPTFGAAAVILIVLLVRKRLDPHVNVLSHFSNSMGAILNMLLISVLLLNFRPFLCYGHPGGDSASLRSFPSIRCDLDNREFREMVIVGIVGFALVPVPFVTVAVYSTYRYTSKMSQFGGEAFLKATGFLFFKFNPTRYYYGLIMMLRSFLICLVPVVVRDQGGAQVMLLTAVLIFFSQVQMYLQPWRSDKTNVADGLQSMLLVLLLVSGALKAKLDPDDDTIAALGITCFALLLFVLLAVVLHTIYRLFKVHPFYGSFICHHKADAAAQARYLKMLLDRHEQETFIDSDHLKDLDTLFDTVKTRVGRLIAYLTRGTLTRPWCCGEITTAYRTGSIKVLKVETPSYLPPTDLQIDRLHDYVDFTCCSLAKYGLTTEDMQAALRWFTGTTLPIVRLDSQLAGGNRFDALITTIRNSDTRGMSRMRSSWAPSSFDAHEAGCLLVSADPEDSEAIAAANILITKIKSEAFRIIQNSTVDLTSLDNCQRSLPAVRRDLVSSARAVVVILSPGSLSSSVQLQVILEAMASLDTSCVIPMSIPGFGFPSEEHVAHNLPSKIYKTEEGVVLIRDFFKLIAISLTTHSSDQMLSAQAREVVARIPRARITMSPSHKPRGASATFESEGSVASQLKLSPREDTKTTFFTLGEEFCTIKDNDGLHSNSVASDVTLSVGPRIAML